MFWRVSVPAFALVLGTLCVPFTYADDEAVIEEIVVTAQKRSQNLQEVPIAITAFSETMIERSGGNSLADMEFAAPSMNFGRGSRRTRGEINIRGVGSFSRNPGFDARASVYVDGVFVGRSGVFDQDMQGVTGVEVLRGPQGTLFGKNTISGAVNINTRKPDENDETRFTVSAGDYQLRKYQIFANRRINDSAFASIALTDMSQDGFIRNDFLDADINGIDRMSGRAKLRLLPSDRLELNFAADFLDEDDRGGNGEGIRADSGVGLGFGQASFSTAPGARRVDHDAKEIETRKFHGFSLTADYDFSDDYTFTSITAQREMEWYNLNEEDYTRQFIGTSAFDEESEQFTQEFRITSPQDGAFSYVAGLYYIDQNISTNRDGTFTGLFFGRPAANSERIPTIVDVDAKGWAAYFNGTWRVTENVEINAGLRYTYDEKDIDFFLPNPTGFAGVLDMTGQAPYRDSYDASDVTPKVGVNWFVNENVMIYGTYSEGFKSGGFNVDFIQTLQELPYNEETAQSVEVGVKSTLWDGRVRLNLAVFDTTFEDFQVQQFQQISPTVSRIAISNAAEANSQGVELEFTIVPIEGLTLTANAAHIDAEFDSFRECNAGVDCTGNDLPYAPELKYFLSAEYEFSINDRGDRLYFRVDHSDTDDYFTHPENTPIVREVSGYDIQNVRVGYESADDKWNIAVWSKNVSDSDHLRMAEINFFGVQRGHYEPPRTVGVTASYNFQ